MDITEDHLNGYVDARYVERGRTYYEGGMVLLHEVSAQSVNATCCGSHLYKVKLFYLGKNLAAECTCPAYEEFGPCKHIAATVLAVIADRNGGYSPSQRAVDRFEELEQVREKLLGFDKEQLVDMVLQTMDEEQFGWFLED